MSKVYLYLPNGNVESFDKCTGVNTNITGERVHRDVCDGGDYLTEPSHSITFFNREVFIKSNLPYKVVG